MVPPRSSSPSILSSVLPPPSCPKTGKRRNTNRAGSSSGTRKFRQKLQGEPVLNANILDYLLANPQLIPEEWKGKAVFFWGTIYRYRHSYGHLFVRYLYWDGEQWLWDYRWLDFDFLGGHPAALLRK